MHDFINSEFFLSIPFTQANYQLYTYTDIVPLNTDKQDIGIFYDTLKEYGAAVGSLKGHEDELNQYLERSNQSSVFNPQK